MSDSERLEIVVLLRRLCAQPGTANTEQILGRCEGAALAASLHLAGELNAKVTAIAVGPARRENRLLAMALRAGCHRAIRIEEPAGDTVDYLGLASVMAPVIEGIGFDVVLCGDRAQDELQGAVGPAVAELLDIAHLSAIVGVHIEDGLIVARQRGDNSFHTYRCGMPSLLCIAAFKAPPKSAVLALLEELGEDAGAPDDDEDLTGPTISVRSGTIEEVQLDEIDLDQQELAARVNLLGRARPSRSGPNATMLSTASDLIARLEDDRLL